MRGTGVRDIRKVAVLGAGTMGSRIAAHVANAGVPVVLLDIASAGATKLERDKTVLGAFEGLKKSKPAAFYVSDAARLVSVGNFEDDLGLVADCDWIIEVVAENLEIKRGLLGRVLEHRRAGAILTTNTSGLPVAEIVEGMPEEVRRHWFGTHFFNPPRYMRLVEIIATSETDAEDLEAVSRFCEQRLGKAVVRSRDTPNFIANRIGTFSMGNAIRLMMEQGLTIEEVDALTGAPLGWPKTGTFRLGDLVGVDVLAHVASNFSKQAERIGDERLDVELAPFISEMVEKKWLGDKVGQGFYKKEGKDKDGRDVRRVLDWRTGEYGATVRPKFAALEMAKNVERVGARIAQLLHGTADKVTAFYWPLLTELFTYAANRVSEGGGEPAATVVEIDRAMKTGFNWELGPFEMMDAVNPRATMLRMLAEGRPVSANVEKLIASADAETEPGPTWYKDDPTTASGRVFFDPFTSTYKPVEVEAGASSFGILKKRNGVVKKNAGASLVDLKDGVGGIELHSKMNALGGDIVSFITQTLKPSSDAVRDFSSFVISGDSANFSVGANLMQLLLSMQEEEWDEVEIMVKGFQNMTQAVKFCPRPVVVAPYGMCLGGGVEIAMHGAGRQAHAELYMGLVETGVGLIPGGGGCKEFTMRVAAAGDGVGVFEALKKGFETIAMAKVSTSAAEALGMGFFGGGDGVTMNRERLLGDAKARAAGLADGYVAPVPAMGIMAPGENALATLKLAVWTMREGAFISEHDAKVANWVAHVLCGGKVTPGTLVSEQYLLDLEREAFLELVRGEEDAGEDRFYVEDGEAFAELGGYPYPGK